METRILEAETVPQLSSANVTDIFRSYFNVKAAWRQIKRARVEYTRLAEMVSTVVEFNNKLTQELTDLREERNELIKALGQFKVVDPNAKCPGCGAADGSIETKQDIAQQQVYVEHTCKICSCRWPESPVFRDLATMWGKPNQR